MSKKNKYPVEKSEKAWKEELSPEEYYILREKGTEFPFTGKFNDHYEKGTYLCKGCGSPLYQSDSKFDSHCGWPSYDQSIEGSLEMIPDHSGGILRIEIQMKKIDIIHQVLIQVHKICGKDITLLIQYQILAKVLLKEILVK